MYNVPKALVASILACFILLSCSRKKESSNGTDTKEITVREPTNNLNGGNYKIPESDSYNDDDSGEQNDNTGIEDGSYNATVEYDNPNTGYSATYTLTVVVSDGMVVQINFPNDGYLDEDHISATEIDEDGNATVEGEDGKTYEVHIEI